MSAPTAQAPGPPAAPARKARGRVDRWKAAFILLAVLGIVAGVAWALLGSRFFIVRSVTVTGIHRVPRSQVLAAADIQLGLPLIRVDTAAASRRVDAILQVQSARVTRSWPDAVVIQVTERTPALATPDSGRFDLIDGSGVVVATVARRPPQMPEFLPSSPVRGNPAVAAAVAVLHQLPAWLSARLVSVTAPGADQVTLQITHGVTVVWGGPDRAAEKARVLAALMRTRARFYDVSSPAVAVTR